MAMFSRNMIAGIELVGELGAGTSSTVYLARSEGREVAVKLLSERFTDNDDMLLRLQREAKTLGELNHPNIIHGFRLGTVDGRAYFVMEYVRGETLAARLNRLGPLPEEEIFDIARGVLEALAAANAIGVIHRDVKPANIIRSDDGVIKLMDFGLARHVDDPMLTALGAPMGTPAFASPEQARGEAYVDTRSDIYALGITLINLVTGEIPFYSRNISLLLTRKNTDDVPDVRQYRPSLSTHLSSFIRKLCARNPEDRPDDPKAAIALLDQLGHGPLRTEIPPTKPSTPVQQEVARDRVLFRDPGLQSLMTDLNLKNAPMMMRAGDVLFYEDDASTDCYILASGKVEILRAGRQVAVVDQSGSFLGEMSSLRHAPRSATARVIDDATFLRIGGDEFQSFLKRHPELNYRLAAILAERLENTTGQLTEVRGKLARLTKSVRDLVADLD